MLSNVSLGAIATDLGGANSTDYQDFIKDFGGGIHGKYQHAVTGQAVQHNDWLHSHIYTTGSRAGTATFHFDDYPAWNPLHTAVDVVSGHIPRNLLGSSMALTMLNRGAGLMVLMLLGGQAIDAGSLVKVWELDLRKVVHGTPDATAKSLPVQLVRFSPDGEQLAVAVAWNLNREVFKGKLLILGTQRPEHAPEQIEISAGIGNEGAARSFGWSTDGRNLFVTGEVVDPILGAVCELPRAVSPPYWPSFLVSNDRLIQGGPELPDADAVRARMNALGEMLKNSRGPIPASAVPPGPAEPRSRFTLFDLQCSPQGVWEVPESWQIRMLRRICTSSQ